MYPNMPYGFIPFPTQNNNTIEDIEKTMKFLDGLRKAQEDKDKDKKKELPKKTPMEMLTTAMFFTMATPVVMLGWFWIMSKMMIDVMNALAQIKGLH